MAETAVGDPRPEIRSPPPSPAHQASAEALKTQLQVAGLSTAKPQPGRGVCSLWDYQLAASPGPALPDQVAFRPMDAVVTTKSFVRAAAHGTTRAVLR